MKNTTTLAAALAMAVPAFAQTSDEELVMQLANPVASLISVPFQSNFDFGMGPLDKGTQYRLSFQPVIPVSMNKDWNLIIRTIVPYVSQEDVFTDVHQDGLSDIVQSFFLSPKAPVGGWILGFGPVLLYPTATDNLLGTEKWAAGPTALALRQSGGWTYGVLANHLWSYAGNEERRKKPTPDVTHDNRGR